MGLVESVPLGTSGEYQIKRITLGYPEDPSPLGDSYLDARGRRLVYECLHTMGKLNIHDYSVMSTHIVDGILQILLIPKSYYPL